jgi:uncharacterized membrane protein YhhN
MPFSSWGAGVWFASVLLSTALLVASDYRRSGAGIWLCKPLASLSFVAFAVALGSETAAERWLLAALCACALADVLLIPDDERAFRAGVASFGLGHALYAVAFALSVARDRFVVPGFVNRAWGLPLYYAAQLVLAATVA